MCNIWLISAITAIVLIQCFEANEYAPIVQTKNGKIRGLVRHSSGGKPVYFYQGIKFGQAKRFEKPEPAQPWSGVYNATSYRYACPQGDQGMEIEPVGYKFKESTNEVPSPIQTTVASEDCLNLNVYQPADNKTNRPVMFWIYGGAFKFGTIFTAFYDGRHLAALGDIVLVEVSYRVGPFGFLTAGTEKEPGNLALYDQLLGLQWVHDNIHHFGGDPNQVTIFGGAAGSVSVGALILSPLTTNLFQRAIMQSGAPNSWVGSESKNLSLEKTVSFAEKLNCTGQTFTEKIECLKKTNIDAIIKASPPSTGLDQGFIPIYGESFLPIRPVDELKKFNKKVDLLFGVVNNEGTGFVAQLLPKMTDPNSTFSLNEVKLSISFIISTFKIKNATAVLEHYTQNLSDNSPQVDLRNAIADVFGDFHLGCPTILFAESVARQQPKNQYYSYRLMQPVYIPGVTCPKWLGVCDSSDLAYVFGYPISTHNHQVPIAGIELNEKDYQLSLDVIKAWTDFAKTGKIEKISQVEWSVALDGNQQNSSTRFMALEAGNYRMVNDYYKESCDRVWRDQLLE